MLMMMGDDGEKEFSAEKGIYWRTDVYGPHSDDHDHDIGDHYDVDHDPDAKASKRCESDQKCGRARDLVAD